MTVEIGLVFGVIALALYLFASQKLPLDVSALAILVTLMAIPIVGNVEWLKERGVDLPAAFPTIEEGLSGLSSPATVTVLAMFILSAGIQRSGLIHVAGKRLVPFVGQSELRLLLVTAGLVGVMSGFVNNTAAVAVAIPLVLQMCRNLGLRASRILMPVSFFGMLGGMLTLIGTSTNILAATLVAEEPELGFELGMFEFTHVGLIVLVTGFLYFLAVGRFLLPTRDLPGERDTDEEFVVELRPATNGSWLGASLRDSGVTNGAGIKVLAIVRDGKSHKQDAADIALEEGDIVRARGSFRAIADLISSPHVDVVAGADGRLTATRGHVLVRALARNRFLYDGQPARNIGFWRRYGARVVGIEATGLSSTRLADERLHVGEILLLETPDENLPRLRRHPDLVLISQFEDEVDRKRMWTAGAIVAAVVLGAALTPLPIVLTALIGVVAMVVTGCVTHEEIYAGVPWDVIILLAGVIPLGVAMTKSGGAEWLGDLIASWTAGWHPIAVMMAFYAFTTLLTEIVSNNASVVILVPVAVTIAIQLDVPVIALVLTVMFAASTSFLSPVGYQTNAMVFGTGLYKFTDFAKVGGPLNAILMVVTSLSIWLFWVR